MMLIMTMNMLIIFDNIDNDNEYVDYIFDDADNDNEYVDNIWWCW